jgi:hypothetical protein
MYLRNAVMPSLSQTRQRVWYTEKENFITTDDGRGREPRKRSPKEQAGVAGPCANLSGERTAP